MGIGTIAITYGPRKETAVREISRAHGDEEGFFFECRIETFNLSDECYNKDGTLTEAFDCYNVNGISAQDLAQILRENNGVLEATTDKNPEPVGKDHRRVPASIVITLQK